MVSLRHGRLRLDRATIDCPFKPYMPDVDWQNGEASRCVHRDAIHWLEAFDLDGLRVDAVKHVEDAAIFNSRRRSRR